MPILNEREALDRLVAEEIVRTLYGSYPTEYLRELVEIGKEFEETSGPNRKVLSLNAALAKEIERREKEAA